MSFCRVCACTHLKTLQKGVCLHAPYLFGVQRFTNSEREGYNEKSTTLAAGSIVMRCRPEISAPECNRPAMLPITVVFTETVSIVGLYHRVLPIRSTLLSGYFIKSPVIVRANLDC